MLGSAVPRRWIFSIALVGLVTIFAVSYSAVWSDPAFAVDSEGTGTGTGNGNPLTPEETLDSADPLPSNLNLQVGQQLSITTTLLDMNGGVVVVPSSALPALTFAWTVQSGSSVALIGATDADRVTIRANATGQTVIRMVATQIQENSDYIVQREMTVNVSAALPTATPEPPPVNPGPVPSSIPNSQAVITPAGSHLVSTTGAETGTNIQSAAIRNRPAVLVKPGAVLDFFGINVNAVDPSTLTPMPSGFRAGSSGVDISFVTEAGAALSSKRLRKAAQVCLPTSSNDRTRGTRNISVMRLNSATSRWIPLGTTYNIATQQICANSTNFSIFAVGVAQSSTPGGGGTLPATGGWSPGTGLLLFSGILGFAFVGGGVVTMRRARRTRSR